MRIAALLLCEAASTRGEGLGILGGGVNVLTTDRFPVLFQAQLAVCVALDASEANIPQLVRVEVRNRETREDLGTIGGEFGVTDFDDEHLVAYMNMAFDLRYAQVHSAGYYEVIVTLGSLEPVTSVLRVIGPEPEADVVELIDPSTQ